MKVRKKKEVLRQLEETPIVSAVCAHVGISRQTFYRWRKEDSEFDASCDEVILIGTDAVNDLAESVVINHVKSGNMGATRFWLQNKHKDYIRPRPKNLPVYVVDEKKNRIDKVQIEFVDFSGKNIDMNM